MNGHSTQVSSLAILDDRTIASGCFNGTIRIWNINTGQTIKTLTDENHQTHIFCLAALPNGALASGHMDLKVRIWNTTTGKILKTLKVNGGVARSLVVRSDTSYFSKQTMQSILF